MKLTNKAEEIYESKCKNSQNAANQLAEFFKENNKIKAIQFLIKSGRRFEAF